MENNGVLNRRMIEPLPFIYLFFIFFCISSDMCLMVTIKPRVYMLRMKVLLLNNYRRVKGGEEKSPSARKVRSRKQVNKTCLGGERLD